MEVFLETTTVVDLLFKERATTEPIKAILDTYDVWYSSQYVRMEIKRGVLRHFVYLHNKAVECKTFAEVQTCISALTSTTQKNKLGTILKAIEGFFVHFERVQLSSLPNDKRPAEFLKTMLAAFKDDLGNAKVVKSTLQFSFTEPVPVKLIERIAKFRAKEVSGTRKS